MAYEVDNARLTAANRASSLQLYHILAMLLIGRAQRILMRVSAGWGPAAGASRPGGGRSASSSRLPLAGSSASSRPFPSPTCRPATSWIGSSISRT
eukprot:2921460-Alexandrium_andersonii.AAC.1